MSWICPHCGKPVPDHREFHDHVDHASLPDLLPSLEGTVNVTLGIKRVWRSKKDPAR